MLEPPYNEAHNVRSVLSKAVETHRWVHPRMRGSEARRAKEVGEVDK